MTSATRRGERLGDYELLEPIEQTSAVEYHLAIDRIRGHRVELKLPIAQGPETAARVAQLVRGANQARELAHPALSRVLALEVDAAGIPFAVEEHLHGETLGQRIDASGNGMPLHRVLQLLTPIVEGMGQAHRVGLVHGCIDREHVVIADAGQAPAARLIRFGGSPVSQAGCAPELRGGDRAPDARSDVWAIAALLHEMLWGTPPAADAALIRLPSHATGLPPDLAALLACCLALDADARPTDASALCDTLQRLRAKPAATRGTLVEFATPRRPRRRRRGRLSGELGSRGVSRGLRAQRRGKATLFGHDASASGSGGEDESGPLNEDQAEPHWLDADASGPADAGVVDPAALQAREFAEPEAIAPADRGDPSARAGGAQAAGARAHPGHPAGRELRAPDGGAAAGAGARRSAPNARDGSDVGAQLAGAATGQRRSVRAPDASEAPIADGALAQAIVAQDRGAVAGGAAHDGGRGEGGGGRGSPALLARPEPAAERDMAALFAPDAGAVAAAAVQDGALPVPAYRLPSKDFLDVKLKRGGAEVARPAAAATPRAAVAGADKHARAQHAAHNVPEASAQGAGAALGNAAAESVQHAAGAAGDLAAARAPGSAREARKAAHARAQPAERTARAAADAPVHGADKHARQQRAAGVVPETSTPGAMATPGEVRAARAPGATPDTEAGASSTQREPRAARNAAQADPRAAALAAASHSKGIKLRAKRKGRGMASIARQRVLRSARASGRSPGLALRSMRATAKARGTRRPAREASEPSAQPAADLPLRPGRYAHSATVAVQRAGEHETRLQMRTELFVLSLCALLFFGVPLLCDPTRAAAEQWLGSRARLGVSVLALSAAVAMMQLWWLQMTTRQVLLWFPSTALKLVTLLVCFLAASYFLPIGALGRFESTARACLPWAAGAFYLTLGAYGLPRTAYNTAQHARMGVALALLYGGSFLGSYRVFSASRLALLSAESGADGDAASQPGADARAQRPRQPSAQLGQDERSTEAELEALGDTSGESGQTSYTADGSEKDALRSADQLRRSQAERAARIEEQRKRLERMQK